MLKTRREKITFENCLACVVGGTYGLGAVTKREEQESIAA